MPHSDPHARKRLNPTLGWGSLTNQDVPHANTTAEWKTTNPATTNSRIKSSSARRSAWRSTEALCAWGNLAGGAAAESTPPPSARPRLTREAPVDEDGSRKFGAAPITFPPSSPCSDQTVHPTRLRRRRSGTPPAAPPDRRFPPRLDHGGDDEQPTSTAPR
jgi:hypothetical protein